MIIMVRSLMIIFAVFASVLLTTKSKKEKIIIDTDAGFDDIGAIYYLLMTKKVDILAITTIGNGLSY